jgi:hypothetical protein
VDSLQLRAPVHAPAIGKTAAGDKSNASIWVSPEFVGTSGLPIELVAEGLQVLDHLAVVHSAIASPAKLTKTVGQISFFGLPFIWGM